jgi:hypothetical protein
LVVLSSVTEMLFADSMMRIDFEPTRFSHQRQVFPDPYSAVVKEYVMVRTEAENVVWRVRPVVRGPEWPDVRGLRVRSGETFQAHAAHLASVVVELFDPSRLRGVSYEPQHGHLSASGAGMCPKII